MARKGILNPNLTTPRARPERTADTAPRGAVGALQSSLTKLQENAVQDIDASLIDDAGVEDRLSIDPAAQRQLVESLKTYGQQVPVLLRPHGTQPGRYEIVYGRRRLAALKELNQPVKAMIRQLDDHALVLAQGQENTARLDLSFIEKASFAAQLAAQDYDRPTIAAALSIDQPMVSRLLKVGQAFDLSFLRNIGAAPGIGRDRWTALAKLLQDPSAKSRVTTRMARPEWGTLTSDQRFEEAFRRAADAPQGKKPPKQKTRPRTLRHPDGTALGDIRATPRGVTLNIPTQGGFETWINTHAEEVLADLHDRWQKQRDEDT